MNYYNEHDPKAAAWLRELIKGGHIAPGVVDERDIQKVTATDLNGFTQCHFFAGIGGWSLALRLAGWPDERSVWTGSCPCPPFSCAGKKKSCPICAGRVLVPHVFQTGHFACVGCGHDWFADGRHLWPEFSRLIRERAPSVVFGEQVAPEDGLVWLAGIRADLEDQGYGVGSSDLCAAGIGAPHIRQRLFWVADGAGERRKRLESSTEQAGRALAEERGAVGGMGLSNSTRRDPWLSAASPAGHGDSAVATSGSCGVVNSDGSKEERLRPVSVPVESKQEAGRPVHATAWSDFYIVGCANGKSRRVESGLQPLVARLPKGVVPGSDHSLSINPQATAEGRVMRLRGYGNSIVPQLAAEFISAYLDLNQ